MDTLALWIAASANVAIAVALMIYYRRQLLRGRITESRAKALFSWLCLFGGPFVALFAFYGLVALLHAPTGHGEILIAAPIFIGLLSVTLIIVGRIVIGWETMRW